ncbi:hypothetical protein LguiB_034350 [Lonicera macranthoides]
MIFLLVLSVGLVMIHLQQNLVAQNLQIRLNPDRQRRRHHYTPSPEPGMEPSQPLTRILIDLSPPHPRSLKEPTENKKKNSKIDTRQVHRCSPYRDDSCEADLSPPRKSRNDLPVSSDLSPPRKIRKESASMTERRKIGLVTGRNVKEEI